MRAILWMCVAVATVSGGWGPVAAAQNTQDTPGAPGAQGAGNSGSEGAAGSPEGEAAEPDVAEVARQHMEQGQEFYIQQRYLEAAEEFIAAYEVQPFGAFLYNAAVAYERHADYARAADYFSRYLEADPDADDAAEVQQRVEVLRTRAGQGSGAAGAAGAVGGDPTVGQGAGTDTPADPAAAAAAAATAAATAASEAGLTVAIGEATAEQMKSLVSIRTNPLGAQVTIRRGDDAVATGPSPLAPTVTHGQYRVIVEHPDYRTVEANVTVSPGQMYVVIVEMSQGQFMGHLEVVSDVPGARVFVDDHDAGEVGRTPWSNVLPVGPHHVWVERPGYDTQELDVEVNLGETTSKEVVLVRNTDGRVRVAANIRGARVFIDGDHVGDVPWEGSVSAGTHRIEIAADGMKSFGAPIEVARGQVTPVRARLRPSPDRGGAWATLVVGAILLGGGITAAVIGADLRSQLEEDRDAGSLANDDERITTGQVLFIAADVAFGLSVVLGALSLYYFLVDNVPDSTGSVREVEDLAVAPYITPTGAGAVGSWSF